MDRYENDDDIVVYDAMSETANRLIGRYVSLSRSASTPQEKEEWMQQVLRVRDERRGIDPGDRAAMREHMDRWAAEYQRLES
ncbi:hypothetical protein J0910_31165 [Nocardiopsis sp. CNT-189]|uniref:hypothetical protein n=1 Tax=Nocardiopsis oceanisediminis TaxID=2816862 RepID=UPI003B310C96